MKKTVSYLSNLEGKKIRKKIDVIMLLLKEIRQ